MSTPKVGPIRSTPPKVIKPTGADPKVSFAETLSTRVSAEKKTAPIRAKTAPDPREQEIKDKLGQQLLQSALGMAKEAKIKKDDTKGGLEGDD